MLHLSEDVLPATFEALRACGGGEQECVVYWLGPVDAPGLVDRVIQPAHRASRGHYEIDSAWLTRFFLDLRTTGSTVRAQVHTHPGRHVEHSPTDDAFALAPSLGFVSLVLPYFATGEVTLDGAYAATVTYTGWTSVAPSELIRCP